LRALLPSRRHALAAALTAGLLFVVYPPFSLVAPAFLALVPLLWMLEETVGTSAPGHRGTGAPAAGRGDDGTPVRRYAGAPWVAGASWAEVARLGYWVGAAASGLVFYWLVIALWHYTPLALVGYLASVLIVLAPGWLAFALGYVWVRRRTGLPVWLVFPLLWTALEWLVGHQGDLAFPWLGLGTSLTSVPTLVQFADLGGARGVTLWLAWVNALVYLALVRRAWRPAALATATGLLALGYGLWREATIVMRPVTTVAVLQPNVEFGDKWDREKADSLVVALVRQTMEAARLPGVRLVAWPEAALPGFFQGQPNWEALVRTAVAESRTPLVAGALDVEFHPDGSYDYFNAAFLFDSTGSRHGQPSYRKTYLVPITERVPFLPPKWFKSLNYFGGLARGDRFPVFRIADGSFGVLICYESIFENLARGYRRDGADFLLNITNDGWFGSTVGPHQHAAHLVMRAIETRMGVARAANTGVSEFVDPLGRVHLATPLEVPRTIAGPVLTTSIRTPYVRFGDWVGALALAGSAALLIAAYARQRHQGASS
jgi:apolipoprotein N-acyltransferase